MRARMDDDFSIAEGIRDYHESAVVDVNSSAGATEKENQVALLMYDLRIMQEKEAEKKRVKELKKLILKFQKKADKKTALRTQKDGLTQSGACSDAVNLSYEKLRATTEEMEDEIIRRFEELSPQEHRKLRKKLGL